MKIHRNFQQGSGEWLKARAGVITASEFGEIMTPEFKPRTGEMPETYLARKLAERWIGGPLQGIGNWQMEQGNLLEDEAIPWYELETGQTVERIGFITTDDGRVGCSPDGLLGDNEGLEIKCPQPDTHVKYLMAWELPKQYRAQVYGSLWVTGFKSWRFLSYRRHFPPLLLTVKPIPDLTRVIGEIIGAFLERYETAWKKLVEINGGPPIRQAAAATFQESTHNDDIIP